MKIKGIGTISHYGDFRLRDDTGATAIAARLRANVAADSGTVTFAANDRDAVWTDDLTSAIAAERASGWMPNRLRYRVVNTAADARNAKRLSGVRPCQVCVDGLTLGNDPEDNEVIYWCDCPRGEAWYARLSAANE